jgi:zinc transport system ATP-binding protein
MLEVDHLAIRFGNTTVVQDLSLRVERGTSLAILGPNGAGKTVLFKALIGAIPFDGTVRWAPDARIGYVPQQLDLERDVPITGIERPIGVLSGGQFQRLLLAFALIGNPNVLLLDEPTAGVDEPGQEQLNVLVGRLQRDHGITVLFISHELTVVYRYATNVLCLSRAHTCMGPPRAVLTPDLLHEMYGAPLDYHVHDH